MTDERDRAVDPRRAKRTPSRRSPESLPSTIDDLQKGID